MISILRSFRFDKQKKSTTLTRTMATQSDSEEEWDTDGDDDDEEKESESEEESGSGTNESESDADQDDEETSEEETSDDGEEEEEEDSDKEESNDEEESSDDEDDDDVSDSESEYDDDNEFEEADLEKGVVGGDEFVDEGNVWASQEGEETNGDEERTRLFHNRTAAIICCLCCCLVVMAILGVVIWLVGNESGDKEVEISGTPPTNKPTPVPTTLQNSVTTLSPAAFAPTPTGPPPTWFPTISPVPTAAPFIEPTAEPTSFPSASPTITPLPTREVPDELQLTPFADTTIFLDGINDLQLEAFGTEDSLLVQDGLASTTQIPDAYFIFAFDMSDVPTFSRVQDRTKNAILELTHIPSNLTRAAATLHLVRLPSTRLAIETVHGGIFVPQNGIEGPSFRIQPSAEVVNIDISTLLFETPIEDNQLLLMVENRGPEQEAGDRFRSRESNSPPKLNLYFVADGQPLPTLPPTTSPFPTITPRPSLTPTLSMAPSDSPKPSSRPTSVPTGSLTQSLNPTSVPTLTPGSSDPVPSVNPSSLAAETLQPTRNDNIFNITEN